MDHPGKVQLSEYALMSIKNLIEKLGEVEFVKQILTRRLDLVGIAHGRVFDFVQVFDYPIVENSEYYNELAALMGIYVSYSSEASNGLDPVVRNTYYDVVNAIELALEFSKDVFPYRVCKSLINQRFTAEDLDLLLALIK